MNTPPQTISIRVVGDVIVDRHFYDSGVDVFEKSELGGAPGLTRLLQKVIEANGAPAGTTLPLTVAVGFEESRLADIPLTRNAYAVWAPYRQNSKQDAPYVWRAARPMGYGCASEPPEPDFQPKLIEGVTPRILVLDDGGFDFRQRAWAGLWSLPAEGEAKPDWIVLKTSRPVAQGDLWHELTHKFADRLVCIVSANELRTEYVGIGTGMSWERTIEDLSDALANNPVLKPLNACRHLIVPFSVDGAIWIERAGEDPPRGTLIFDPACAEGEWGEAREGKAFGYLSCMAAAIAHAVAEHAASGKKRLDLGRAIGAGLGTMRDLLDHGHGVVGAPPIGYPVARLVDRADRLAPASGNERLVDDGVGCALRTRRRSAVGHFRPFAPDRHQRLPRASRCRACTFRQVRDGGSLGDRIEAHIELLAEAEHEDWMAQRAKNGWRYGVPRDDARKLHPLMMPYRDLPEAEKEKDRAAVRRYPARVNAAGFATVWL